MNNENIMANENQKGVQILPAEDVKKTPLKNRYEFAALVEVRNANGNGDPDRGNLQRIDDKTGIGIITDTAIKRRIRNYIETAFIGQPGMEIMIRKGSSISREIAEGVLIANGISSFSSKFENKKVPETSAYVCSRYWDVRAFGGVLSVGRNAGQIQGAVQICMAESVDPVEPTDITITRMAYTANQDFETLEKYDEEWANRPEDKRRTMGTKQYIPYGLFVVKGSVSPYLAERNGFTEEDLNALFEALLQAYDFGVSSSKAGISCASPLYIFKHVGTQSISNAKEKEREAFLGCAPAQKNFSLLHVEKKEGVEYPRKLDDYKIYLDLDHVPAGVEIWKKEMPFSAPEKLA